MNDLGPAPGDMGEDESETPVVGGARKLLVAPPPESPWNEATEAMAEQIRVALRERLNLLGDQGYVLVGSWSGEYLVFVRPRPLAK